MTATLPPELAEALDAGGAFLSTAQQKQLAEALCMNLL